MTMVGCARVSTDQQSFEAQTDTHTELGCKWIFTDTLSGARDDRPGLTSLLGYVCAGDTVDVTPLDRLGRSLSAVIRTVETLTAAGVLLRSLREGIDYSTPTGRLPAGIFAPSPSTNASSCTNAPRPPGSRPGCEAGTAADHPG